MIALVQVYLRALGLVGQSVAIGGAVLGFLVLRRWLLRERDVERDIGRALGTVAMGAALAAACQVGSFLVVLASTAGPDGWPVTRALGTPLFFAALARVLLFGAVIATSALVRGSPRSRARWLALVALAAAATASAAWISHAVGRLDRGALLLALDAAHQLAAGVWVGSLVHLLVLAWRRASRPWPAEALRRFSLMAQGAVVTLAAAAVGLWFLYIGGPGAALGTAYGAMTLTKSVLFLGLLGLGALNFLAARRLRGDAHVPPLTLRRLVEVEVGAAVTVLFLAAALGSVPPAVDQMADRATLAEIAFRFTPRWPTLSTPSFTELAQASDLTDKEAPRTIQDSLWSEYNHNVSGLFVLAMGLLAVLERTGRASWARNWPLLFVGLGAFLLFRSDPETWPLGPQGFWQSLGDPEVLQHRLLGVLPAIFGVFEWLVRTGRLRDERLALVFPFVCAISGALLLAHAHTLQNIKEAYLMEVTHLPLAVVGIVVGWSRWLELRLPEREGAIAGRVWAPGLALVGLLLLFYREI
jgi:putative copper resistance protein D